MKELKTEKYTIGYANHTKYTKTRHKRINFDYGSSCQYNYFA